MCEYDLKLMKLNEIIKIPNIIQRFTYQVATPAVYVEYQTIIAYCKAFDVESPNLQVGTPNGSSRKIVPK